MFRSTVWIVAVFALAAVATSAEAGEVRLVSDTWDYICKVEVKWGNNAPDRGDGQVFTDVQPTFSLTKTSRICYRRSGDPDNCESRLTPWSCCDNPASGTDEPSLS